MRETGSEGCRTGLCKGPRRRHELGRSHRGSFRHGRDMLFLNEHLNINPEVQHIQLLYEEEKRYHLAADTP